MNEGTRRQLMLDLISRLEAHNRVYMTVLQKLPYFLQEVMGVPLGVRFVMHHYGPYSFDLAHAIEAMAATGEVSIVRDPSGYGYRVSVVQEGASDENAPELNPARAQYLECLDILVRTLGKLQWDDLELLSTSHFVRRLLERRGLSPDTDRVVDEVYSLKPKFGRQRAAEAAAKLDEVIPELVCHRSV